MKLITETIENIEVLKEEKADGKKDYKIRGVFMQADIKNRNGRIYPVETLAKEVKRSACSVSFQQWCSTIKNIREI